MCKTFFSDFFCQEERNKVIELGLALSAARSALLKNAVDMQELHRQLEISDQNYRSCIANFDATKAQMQLDLDALKGERLTLQKRLDDAITSIKELMERQEIDDTSLLPQATQELLKEYWNRYAEADITYNGRWLGTKDRRYYLDLKAFALEGANDKRIIDRVVRGNCYVKNIMKERGLDFHRACDIAVMNVSNVFGCNYAYDSATWGTSEFWMFASETEAFGQGDCEDMAIWRYVGCRIAGIPHEMLRIGAGITFTNEGHATNFYFASDLKWHHINSTSNYGSNIDIRVLPVTQDSKDPLNIKDVWFSFNEKKAWHDLVTSSQKIAIHGREAKRLLKHFKIIPVMGKR